MDVISPVMKTSYEDFERLHFLGKGSYGRVYQVRKKCGQDINQIYAMKILNKCKIVEKDKKIEHAFSEKNILKAIKHPFIVKLIYTFQSETELYFILEYVNGGNLRNLLKKEKVLSQNFARFYLNEIVLAVGYLHSKNIIYRDLKPENILLDMNGHVKIIDFGLSKKNLSSAGKTYTMCGTLTYAAPELIKNKGYSKEIDWWSLGVITFRMLTGECPFLETYDHNLLAENIVRGVYCFPSNFELTSSARDLIQLLLIVNPDLRLGSSGVEEIKQHKFFKKTRWDQVLARLEKPPHLPHVVSMTDVSCTSMKDDSFESIPSNLGPSLGITESQNKHFNGFSFTSSELLLDIKCDNEDFASGLSNEEKLPENHVTRSKKLSNAIKYVKSLFKKTN